MTNSTVRVWPRSSVAAIATAAWPSGAVADQLGVVPSRELGCGAGADEVVAKTLADRVNRAARKHSAAVAHMAERPPPSATLGEQRHRIADP